MPSFLAFVYSVRIGKHYELFVNIMNFCGGLPKQDSGFSATNNSAANSESSIPLESNETQLNVALEYIRSKTAAANLDLGNIAALPNDIPTDAQPQNETDENKRAYVCEICGQRFAESVELDEHNQVHRPDTPLSERRPSISLGSNINVSAPRNAPSDAANQDATDNEANKRPPTVENINKCDQCEYSTDRVAKLNTHKLNKHPIICGTCLTTFNTIEDFNEHQERSCKVIL